MRHRLILVITLAALIVGCGPEPERPGQVFVQHQGEQDQNGYLLCIALDLSGSFRQQMTSDSRAFEFCCGAIDKYLRQRAGSNDEIIIAQFSNPKSKPLLWQGSAMQLREEFADPDDFRKMLLQKSDPNGSRIHDGLTDLINYTLTQPGVTNHRRRCVTLVLSDLYDTEPNPAQAKARMMKALKTYAGHGGCLGLYWVDQTLMDEWRRNLTEAGFNPVVIQSEIKNNPTLPDFDQ